MTFTATLADWVAGAPARWDERAIAAAERSVLDTVACLLAGQDEAPTRRARAGVAGWGGGGSSSAVGLAHAVDSPWAALVNATSAHALDYDDVLDPASSHVSAALVPALLARGEELGASGHDLLDAFIVGVEVEQCLAEALNMAHYARGWHTTLTFGAPAVAAACARLARLDASATRHAISLGTSSAGGFKRQFGSNAKPLHAGLAARDGIVAARLAEAGLTADAQPFEGAGGFLDLMAPGAPGFARAAERLGGTPAVLRPGLWLKQYPCCASTHRSVDALLQVMAAHDLREADLAEVRCEVSAPAAGNLMYDRPENPMQARFSMPYCIAWAMRHGALGLDAFRFDDVDPGLQAPMSRVVMAVDPDQPADMPSSTRSWSTVTVTTRAGRVIALRVTDPKGHPDQPLDEAELLRKFEDCTAARPAALRASAPRWRGLSREPSLRALGALLRA